MDRGLRTALAQLLPELRAFARYLSGSRTEADDLVQEALLKASAAGLVPQDATIVCTVTGHGLKDPQWALKNADGSDIAPVRVPAEAYAIAGELGLQD